MADSEQIDRFKDLVAGSISNQTFIKATLGNYQGTEPELKNIYVRKVVIKREDRLAFTYRYQTRDIVKNYVFEEGLSVMLAYLSSGFRNCTCFTAGNDIVFLRNKSGASTLNLNKPSMSLTPVAGNDKEKARLIASAEKTYLTALRITDQDGVVFKNAQDKYKQINQYVTLLDPLIKDLPAVKLKKVVDMGSGKGYLTFALYDYLVNVLKREVTVTGVEYREDLVELCNRIAGESGFTGLSFTQGTIESYDAAGTDLLIALHACDTATDDAIAKGIGAGAELIVVAPCCHKQIRREIEKGKAENALDFITRHGIFLERQAVMVTDSIRALILEYFGYKTKVFEFISEANTPKNVLITGAKAAGKQQSKSGIKDKISNIKQFFGIGYHHLEKLMGL